MFDVQAGAETLYRTGVSDARAVDNVVVTDEAGNEPIGGELVDIQRMADLFREKGQLYVPADG